MALDAGSVYATLGGRYNRDAFVSFDRDMVAAEARTSKFEQAFTRSTDRSHESAKRFATGAAKVGAVGVAGFGYAIYKAVDAAADFQAQLSSLQSVTGATGGELDKLRKQAMDAGAQTKYSALEAAQAQTELAKGGLSTAKILSGGLKGALALAAAGELDLADAASYTANALNLFKLGGDQAGHVADALATAANSTTADVGDFGIALTQGGAAAKAAGLNFDETVAALESLALAGVKGSDAGTSLKTALTQIAAPTKQSKTEMDKLGLSFFNAQGQMKPLTTISADLRDKLGGLNKQQRLQAATTIAGTDGFRALLALYDAGPAKVRRLQDELGKEGTAADVAAKKQDNLKGKLENLGGSIETAAITVGNELIPILERGAEQLTTFINTAAKNGDIQRFGEKIADGLQTGIDHIPDVVHGIEDIGHTAADVYNTVKPFVHLLTSIDPHVLEGAALGLGAFRVAQTVVPGVMNLGRGLNTVATAARTAPTAGAFLADIVEMAGPAGIAAGALAALGAAIVVLSSRETDEEHDAKAWASAKRDQAAAAKELQEAVAASADAGLRAEQADLDHASAVDRLNQLRKEGKKGTKEWTQAVQDERQSSLDAKTAHDQAADSITKENAAAAKAVEHAKKTRDSLSDLLKTMDQYHLAGSLKTKLEEHLADASRQYIQALAAQNVSEASRARLMKSSTAITAENAQGVSKLIEALKDVPASKQAKLLVDNQDALAKAGDLSAQLTKIGKGETVATILAHTDNAKVAVSAFQAVLRGVPDKTVSDIVSNARTTAGQVQAFKAVAAGVPAQKVSNILTNANTAAGQVRGLKTAIDALHDKTVTVTTVQRAIASRDAAGGHAHAAGRRAGASERALVGEGRDPREYVVDGDTGAGFITTGPTVTDLGPRDYVIPIDPARRGGAMGLFMALAKDLGVSGFAAGRKPYVVPKRISEGGAPFDDVKQRYDAAKSSDSSADEAVTSAKKSVGSEEHRLGRVQKGKTHDRERSNARDALDKAKTKQSHAEAHAKRTAAALAKARADYEAARKFDVQIRNHESQINVLRDEMDLAAKNGDGKTFAAKKSARATKLTELRALLVQAQQAGAKGDYLRQINEQISGLDVDAKNNEGEALDQDAPEAYTDAEQTFLDSLDANLSLERSDPDHYDGTESDWLSKILAVEQGALGRSQAAGAAPTLIKQIADDITSTKSELANLVTTKTSDDPDLQAQLTQSQERERVANDRAKTAEDFSSVLNGAGDLGFARAAAPTININTLHPGSPEVLRALGDASTAGQSLQGSRRSNRSQAF